MDKVNKKLIKHKKKKKLPPSEKFWKAEKLIIREKKSAGVIVEMRRSMFKINLLKLLNEKAITMEDLADFSPELQEEIKKVKERLK